MTKDSVQFLPSTRLWLSRIQREYTEYSHQTSQAPWSISHDLYPNRTQQSVHLTHTTNAYLKFSVSLESDSRRMAPRIKISYSIIHTIAQTMRFREDYSVLCTFSLRSRLDTWWRRPSGPKGCLNFQALSYINVPPLSNNPPREKRTLASHIQHQSSTASSTCRLPKEIVYTNRKRHPCCLWKSICVSSRRLLGYPQEPSSGSTPKASCQRL